MSDDIIDLLPDVGQWQASSHPALANCKPEDLFPATFAERYLRLHKDLWWRIIRLHGTISTLEQLRPFPLDHLYALDGMEFWRLVIQNFLDGAVLMLHALVNDTGEDVHSLPLFRGEIIKGPWLSEEKCELLKQTLRERKVDGVVERIAQRVHRIRDNIAHRLVDKQSGGPKEVLAGVSLEEIRRLFDASHALFGALSFGSSYVTLAGDLTPTFGNKPARSCLDKVLDAVLHDSDFVNRPERRAPWWSEERKYIGAERLQVMNTLRKRIGLGEA